MMRLFLLLAVMMVGMSTTMAEEGILKPKHHALKPSKESKMSHARSSTQLRFSKVDSKVGNAFIDLIKEWKGKIEAGKTHAELTINEKMCTVRVMVKEQEEKHPMAFFIAKNSFMIGSHILLGLATAGIAGAVDAIVTTTLSAIKEGADAVHEMYKIKASKLTVAAKMACATKESIGHLQAVMIDGMVAFIESETGIDVASVTQELKTTVAEVDNDILKTAAGPGMIAVQQEYEAMKSAAGTKVAETFGFDCSKLCMLDPAMTSEAAKQILDEQGAASGQTYCKLPEGMHIGRFICKGGVTGADGRRGGMACSKDKSVMMANPEDYGEGLDKWVTWADGEVSGLVEDWATAQQA